MSDWEEQLSSILGDPEQMGRIAEMAKSLMGGGEEPPSAAPTPDAGALSSLMQSVTGSSGKDRAQTLLEAMKPWLSEKRRAKIDRAVKLARMAKLAEMAMGEGERKDV